MAWICPTPAPPTPVWSYASLQLCAGGAAVGAALAPGTAIKSVASVASALAPRRQTTARPLLQPIMRGSFLSGAQRRSWVVTSRHAWRTEDGGPRGSPAILGSDRAFV